jgi:hypothetical protein
VEKASGVLVLGAKHKQPFESGGRCAMQSQRTVRGLGKGGLRD